MLFIATLLLVSVGHGFSQEWVSSSNGRSPLYAFSGGTYDEGHNSLYICKGRVPGTVACGKVNSRLGNCRIPFAGEEHTLLTGYEVLTSPPWAEYTLEWTSSTYSNGEVPSNAVEAGYGVFPGRYRDGDHHELGKVVPRRSYFYYGDNGRERAKNRGYQVLRMRPRRIDHYELYNVVYDLSQASITHLPDLFILASKTVQNNSKFATTATLSMEITQSTTSEWSEMEATELHTGLTISVSAGIPEVLSGSVEWETGESSTSSYSHGESYTTSVTTTHEVSVALPAFSHVKVKMIGKKARVNVPYRATLRTFFADGNVYNRHNVAGVYKNVHHTSFESVVESEPDHEATQSVIEPAPFNDHESSSSQSVTEPAPSIDTKISGAIKSFPFWSKTFMLTFYLGFFRLI